MIHESFLSSCLIKCCLVLQVKETWAVAARMQDIPGPLIAAALIPGIIIAILFWFDHGVSAKLGMPAVGKQAGTASE